MALSWNEIKDRALKFTKEWEGESRERAEKDSFWNDFFYVFGVTRRRLASFEEPVKKLNNQQGYIDLFWPGTLIVEHKSKGKDLTAAFKQATDYFQGLKEHELPKYVIVSDFEKFKFYDLDDGYEHEFKLKEFHSKVKLFGFIAGYQKVTFKDQDPVNIKAAESMGKVHDQLKSFGYEGHNLEVFLVRILFCLFADDTGIFEKDIFRQFIEDRTKEDGSDLGSSLAQIFQTLNKAEDKRLKNLSEELSRFPYVNGKLFAEVLPIASFNSAMRTELLRCCVLDWGKISPAIFGSMFQSVMEPTERRQLGAHYTSENNIMKLIHPLFLDDLQTEFKKIKTNKNKLKEFHSKLSSLKFLDPACGCGNFLVITYREIRLLELEVLKILQGSQHVINIDNLMKVDVDQFFGIEYEEFPARIAEVALWLMDHQMNLIVSEYFGLYYARLPLSKSANIVNDNALTLEWESIVDKGELSYILGNPPFLGSKYQTSIQREEIRRVAKGLKNAGILDYVTAWYILASKYIQGTNIEVGFVSTNSITQGEQVGVLWSDLIENKKIIINFAHRTFQWTNEARGKAKVHCVIIGFSQIGKKKKYIYDYDTPKSDPKKISAKNINPYLVDGSPVIIKNRKAPICKVPQMSFGNMPLDGGNLLLSDKDKIELEKIEPKSSKYIKPLISAKEFLNGKTRWCIWLVDVNPKELRSMPEILKRIQSVKTFRLNSVAPSTRKFASIPYLFRDRQQPKTYILIPSTTSENRRYIPLGLFGENDIANNSCYILPNGNLYHFGILNSELHMVWMRYTAGRLKSDYRYSAGIVYNNFPWPKDINDKQKNLIENKAKAILDVRKEYKDSTLADLYDPLVMPQKLMKAHNELDKAVDKSYRAKAFKLDIERIEFLFKLYSEYIS